VSDSFWRCFVWPKDFGWNRPRLRTYPMLVVERIRLRHSERPYARVHPNPPFIETEHEQGMNR
jgi:hypothetical protein